MSGFDPSFLHAPPDAIIAEADPGQELTLRPGASDWQADGLRLRFDGSTLRVSAERPLCRLLLRWRHAIAGPLQILGDHWERGYGDLEWRGIVPERYLPWYALVHDGAALHGLGVATGGGAFAAWQLDGGGITLRLDLRCGASALQLGGRELLAARIVTRRGDTAEDEHAAAQAFCRALCPAPRLPASPVYGHNDWYYAYGRNSQRGVLRDGALLARLSAGLDVRPFQVIDAGWQRGAWASDNRGELAPDFTDMAELAAALRDQGLRPGIWQRPLLAGDWAPADWRLQRAQSGDGVVLDPSVPAVRDWIAERIAQLRAWGYELIKHDFSTYDCFGRWGFAMQPEPASGDWAFADRSRSSAEIIAGLYATIRAAAGDALLIGCNTIGHLAAGSHELQRTGDDTSGRSWERTRRMGINTLAMRAPQHRALFLVDADCVGLSGKVPWALTAGWLDLLARSGTPLFVSADPAALGAEQEAALRRAYALAASDRATAVALDWRQSTQPRHWRDADGERQHPLDAPLGALAGSCPG